MDVVRSQRGVICAGPAVPLTGVMAGMLWMFACASGAGQMAGPVLPEGPRPQVAATPRFAEAEAQAANEAPKDGAAQIGAAQGGAAQDGAPQQQPSPIPPSRVNAGSKATPGPLTQGERTQYVLRQLVTPEHVFGYSAGALLKMASPPGHGSTYYPREWRVGGPGFARNFGDQAARDQAKHLAKYGAGALLREDPRYDPSASSNVVRRAWDALLFTFVDRSNDGERRPALSNLAGAAAGYVGDAYLPPGFRNQAHATQRSLVSLVGFAAENGEAEFKPEIRAVLRKLHLPFVR